MRAVPLHSCKWAKRFHVCFNKLYYSVRVELQNRNDNGSKFTKAHSATLSAGFCHLYRPDKVQRSVKDATVFLSVNDMQRNMKSHECFMAHNGSLGFLTHTLASTDTRDRGLSWHLRPKHTQRHMVCNSHTSGVLAAVDCGQSYELWIWANCFLIWKFLFIPWSPPLVLLFST